MDMEQIKLKKFSEGKKNADAYISVKQLYILYIGDRGSITIYF